MFAVKSDALTYLTVGQIDGSAAQSGYVLDSAEQALVVPMALALQFTVGLVQPCTQLQARFLVDQPEMQCLLHCLEYSMYSIWIVQTIMAIIVG